MIERIDFFPVTFNGYRHPLKDLYKEGKMPSVKRGLYGGKLDVDNASLEHLKPHSQGGKTTWRNLALAERTKNMARGNKPLADFLSWDMLEAYLAQFNFRIAGIFDGFLYQNQIRKTCKELGVQNNRALKKLPDKLEQTVERKLSKKELRSLRNKAKKHAKAEGTQLEIQFPPDGQELNIFA